MAMESGTANRRRWLHVLRCGISPCLLAAFHSAVAQYHYSPQEYTFALETERRLARKDSALHTGLKPYSLFFSDSYRHVPDSQPVFRFIKDDEGIDKVFHHHLIDIAPRNEPVRLRLDPLLNLEYGADPGSTDKRRLFTNTRGFTGGGSVGKNFYFETMFAENQAFLPDWLAQHVNATGVIPGQGRWKGFRQDGYDYAFASGFAAIRLSPNINIIAGHGKHKAGHGYRSLLLSDNAFNYPYVRISQQWLKGRLQYHNIYAVFMNLVPAAAQVTPNAERLFQKKPAAFQYLSVNPSGRLSLSLFQGVIWRAGDRRNRQHLGWEYLNPLIFGQAASFGLSNRNNVLLGAELKFKFSGKTALYMQGMIDEVGAGDARGIQAGLLLFDFLDVRNFFFQAEYNYAGAGSYRSPVTQTDQSWSHMNENIAFTPGQGSEVVMCADYRRKRLFFTVRYHYQDRPNNLNVNTYLNIVNARAGYIINPSYNLNISVGMLYRKQIFSNFIIPFPGTDESSYLSVSLRTSLYNIYYDF